MGVVNLVNLWVPPQHDTDRLGSAAAFLERAWPVSWCLDTGCCHPAKTASQTRGWEWNKTGKQDFVPEMLTLNLFPTVFVLIEGGATILWCHLGHLSCTKGFFLLICSPTALKHQAGDGPEQWRKIGDHKEDLRGIPACKVEIGNWAVVITGCGIDVVPINQNCWINKNCSRIFCRGSVQKMFQTLSPSISCCVPEPTAVIWQNSCLCAQMHFFPPFHECFRLCSAYSIYIQGSTNLLVI